MKKPTLISLTISSLILLSGFMVKERGWIIGPETKLIIHGQTNVNSFQCKMDCYNQLDTLSYYTDDDQCMIFFKENMMNIPIVNFDCENKMINRDFYEVLKSDRHPHVKIQFVALERWTGDTHVGGTAFITLAGVTKPFTVNYDVKSNATLLLLKGNQKICFSDFGLKAPEKMMGLIKVQDNLEVEFHLALRAF
jgi:hypothetical protein